MRRVLWALLLGELAGAADGGSLFRASLEREATAEYAAGDPRPLQAQGIRFREAAELPAGARLTYDARGNLYAEQGAVSFWWRPDEPLGRVSFPLLLVSYEQHSSWDFNFLRIGWSGTELMARVSDRNAEGRTVRAAVRPQVGQWMHLAVSWSEADGLAFYVDGRPAGRAAGPLALDAGLDQFGLLTRAVTPHHTAGNENAGAVRDVRIYRVWLGAAEIARLAAGEEPGPVRRSPSDWPARFGWSEAAGVPRGSELVIRRVPVLEAKDLGKFWLKGVDGKRQTLWPMISHGYAGEGRTYRIRPAAEPVNLIRTTGNLAGRITLAPNSVRYARPGGELHYYRLAAPAALEEITIERDAGALGDLACLRLEAGAGPEGRGWITFSPAAGEFLRDRRDPETFTVWRPGPAAAAPSGPRYHHYLLPLESETPLGAVRVRLESRLAAYYYFAVSDPINPSRHLIEADVRATASSLDVTLDFPDLWTPPGTTLALTVAASTPQIGRLQAQIIAADPHAARGEHVAERLLHLRDSFQMLSEARPWMQISNRLPAAQLRRQLKLVDELYSLMEDLRRVDPAHPIGQAYWGWVNRREAPPPFQPPAPSDASTPLWAHRQLILLEQFRRITDWWIANRQIETGEMGGGLGDDTDLIQNWPAVALLDGPAQQVRDSARRVLEACYAQGLITNGMNRMRTDALHAYEEGMNALGPAFLLDYGNPVLLERMMQTAAHYRRLTGVNAAGHRHFRSYIYSATDLVEEGYHAREDIYSHLILHPGLYVAWYNGLPAVTDLLKEFADSLLDHWRRESYPNLARTIFFADDRVAGRAPPASETFNLFWGLYEISGDRRYLWLLEQAVRAGDFANAAYANGWWLDLFPGISDALRAEAQRRNVHDHNLQTDQAGLVARVLAWQAGGGRELLEEAQAALVQHLAQNMYLYTEAEQFTDRIWIPTLSVQRERLGGVAHYRNYIYPGHAVSWEQTEGTVAALVTASRPDFLRLEAFNREPKPRRVRMRVWRLENGRYRVTLRDSEGGLLWEAVASLKRYAPLEVELPGRRTATLEIRELERGTPLDQLPDLALAAEEIRAEGILEAPVHNIGAAASGAFLVRASDEEGRVLAEVRCPPLEAPLDLKPRVAMVRFEGLRARPGLRLEVVQEGGGEEITEANNRVTLSAGR